MKRILLFVLTLTLILILTACSNKNQGVDLEVIQADVNELSEVKEGIIKSNYTPNTPYTMDSFEIEKRQTNIENKEDIIFYNVKIHNEYYESNLKIKLIYNYYDDGGWILDEYEIVDKYSKPLCGISIDMLNLSYYLDGNNKFAVGNYTISQDSALNELTDNIYIAETKNNYTIYAIAEFIFDNTNGWATTNIDKDNNITPVIYDIEYDYAKVMKGTFEAYQKYHMWIYEEYREAELKITSYNRDTNELQGSYYYYDDGHLRTITSKNFKAIINKKEHPVVSVTFTAARDDNGKNGNITTELFYNFDNDTWKESDGTVEMKRK